MEQIQLSAVVLGFCFLLVAGLVLVPPWCGMAEGWQGFSCCLTHPEIIPQDLGAAVPKWTQPG